MTDNSNIFLNEPYHGTKAQELIEAEQCIRDFHQERIQTNHNKALEKGRLARHRPVRTLINIVLPSLLENCQHLFNVLYNPKARLNKGFIQQLQGEPYERYCLIALTACICSASKQESLNAVIARIGDQCNEENAFLHYQKINRGLFKYKMDAQLKKHGMHQAQIARAMRVEMNRAAEDFECPELSYSPLAVKYRECLGATLLDFCMGTGLFNLSKVTTSQNKKTFRYLMPSQKFLDWVDSADTALGLSGGYYLPIPDTPRDWTTPHSGGYWTIFAGQLNLVKNKNTQYQEELDGYAETGGLNTVMNAVNVAQHTAWRINERVYEIMLQIVEEGKETAGLPPQELRELPRCPKCRERIIDGEKHNCFHTDTKVLKLWKQQAYTIWQKRGVDTSHRLRLSIALEDVNLMLSWERFYYVYQLDFRGRLYAKGNVTPQGSDWEKGLLEFADGKPLGKHGAKWLAIHVANCFGEDKINFEGRVRWVNEHRQMILNCAQDPLEHREWTESDSPFCFLAACFEWAGYLKYGEDFVSHLAVALDGSCSGIQHYSALLRDKVGAEATNVRMVEPNPERKSDIYALVAEVAKRKVNDFIAEAEHGKDAAFLLSHNIIDRKAVKRAVMTMPYGSTSESCKEYCGLAVKEACDKKMLQITGKALNQIQDFLGTIVWESIPEVVKGAREGMNYIKNLAQGVARNGKAVSWITPTGLPVYQAYTKDSRTAIRRFVGGGAKVDLSGNSYWEQGAERIYVSLKRGTEDVDSRKQATGAAPNFVHSLDASHLSFSILAASRRGFTSFALIHDSLGVHACDTEEFACILREQFHRLYTEFKPLDDLTDRLKAQMKPRAIKELPAPPYIDTLNLCDILKAEYLFS